MDPQETTYWELIATYRRKMEELQKAERKDEDKAYILFLDKERDDIHNKLRRLAQELGKDRQDVDIDILSAGDNLSEYQLDEFRLVRLNDLSGSFKHQGSGYIKIESVDETHLSEQEEEWNTLNIEALQEEGKDLFIPFGEDDRWHLFDHQTDFFYRPSDSLERRRRGQHVASALSSEGISFVTIDFPETFHRGVRIYGILVSKHDLPKVLQYLREHRSEVSIQKKYFDQEQIRLDYQRILDEGVQEIYAYGDEEKESLEYLLERFFDIESRDVDDALKNLLEAEFDRRKKKLKEFRIQEEIAREKERIDREADDDILLPKREGMGRRK